MRPGLNAGSGMRLKVFSVILGQSALANDTGCNFDGKLLWTSRYQRGWRRRLTVDFESLDHLKTPLDIELLNHQFAERSFQLLGLAAGLQKFMPQRQFVDAAR